MSSTVQSLRLSEPPADPKSAPDTAGALARAVALHLAGKRDEALDQLQRAASGQPSAEVYRAMGHIQFELGRFEAAASSYRVDGDAITPGTASVGNGRSEICWAVISNDGRYAFTTNFADGAVSRYAIGMDGGLTLEDATAGITEDGRPGLRDEDLSDDGRFLYAIDADQGRIVAWSVDGAGRLSMVGSWDGVPTTVAGLAAV
jgi:6-phosphogluconolactonase (cycloisomerase 2 family)